MEAACVGSYQNMLNRHFYPKSVFIVDSDLVSSIQEVYGYIGSSRGSGQPKVGTGEQIFTEIHKRTNGTLLSSFRWLLLSIQSLFDERFDFVEVDLGDQEIKGKAKDIELFKAFF